MAGTVTERVLRGMLEENGHDSAAEDSICLPADPLEAKLGQEEGLMSCGFWRNLGFGMMNDL